jgi:hypothetical protein
MLTLPERGFCTLQPADDRVGPDEHQVAPPVSPDEACQEPEEPVAGPETWPLPCGSAQDHQLLAQQEVLGDQIAARAQDRSDHTAEEA